MRLAALCLLLPALASAQPAPRRADGVVPTAKSIYAADDPAAALKMQIERLMGVYLVDPPRRHASEKVVVKVSVADDQPRSRPVTWHWAHIVFQVMPRPVVWA